MLGVSTSRPQPKRSPEFVYFNGIGVEATMGLIGAPGAHPLYPRLLTHYEARRIAANIAKLPELLAPKRAT
jgi:hypothetical protein